MFTMLGTETLKVNGNMLTGLFPANIGNLLSLEVLDLGDNQMGGPIGASVGNLGALRKSDSVARYSWLSSASDRALANLQVSLS